MKSENRLLSLFFVKKDKTSFMGTEMLLAPFLLEYTIP